LAHVKLGIIGAAGFLGRATVEAALEQGLDVRAVVRPARAASSPWPGLPVEVRGVDLRLTESLAEALQGCSAVIHLVAARDGSLEEQLRETEVITTSLVAAARAAGVRRLIGVSSFSVYDHGQVRENARIDESCPLIDDDPAFGAYAQGKRRQEQLLRNFDGELCIVRPGIIYGAGALWHAAYGRPIGGRLALRMGPGPATVPVIYVRNCADALVCAAKAAGAAGAVVNLLDDEPPTRAAFFASVIAVSPRRHGLRFPMFALTVAAAVARLLSATTALLLRRPTRVPTVLSRPGRDLLFKSFTYDNRQAHERLGWTSRRSRGEAFREIDAAAP
jgi:nucleoside-diphosphate-sugar epimerase